MKGRGEKRGGGDGGDAPFSKAIQPDHAKEWGEGEEEEGSKKKKKGRREERPALVE